MDSRLRYWDYKDAELFPFEYVMPGPRSMLRNTETWFERTPPVEGDNRAKCQIFDYINKGTCWERGTLNKWAKMVRLLKDSPFVDPDFSVEYVTLEIWIRDKENPLSFAERMAHIKYFTEGWSGYEPDKTYNRYLTGWNHPDMGGAPGYRDGMTAWQLCGCKPDPQLELFN